MSETTTDTMTGPSALETGLPPLPPLLHAAVEQWAVRKPGALAVVHQGHALSHGELDAAANAVAQALLDMDLPPESRVAVCGHKSVWLVAAMLGVLKAGGAWVPIDAEYPEARQRFMLEDSGARALLLCDPDPRPGPVARTRIPRLHVPDLCLGGGGESPGAAAVEPDRLAYQIYTSGSTGQPKGVMIEHRNIIGFLRANEAIAPAPHPLVATAVHSISFDVFVEEVFSCLAFGGCLHLLPRAMIARPEAFFSYLADHGITASFVPPLLMEDLAIYLEDTAAPLPLRRLLTGVSPVPGSIFGRIQDQIPEAVLINSYGPTEATIYVTWHIFSAGDPRGDEPVPLGRPLPGCRVDLVDGELRPVPPGKTGEILIRGIGVGRGYHQRPDREREAFVRFPGTGERAYRTGDLAVAGEDGVLRFVGRRDNQIKFHGLRMEPEEIETALARHPAVRQAVVRVRRDAGGAEQLHAFIRPQGNARPGGGELRAFLMDHLPLSMVPTRYVLVEDFPLTPNGKIDVQALLAMEDGGESREGGERAPRTPTERVVAEAWAEVLEREIPGVDADFFEMGGDSLRMLALADSLERRLGREIQARGLIRFNTVAGQAAALDRGEALERRSLVALRPRGTLRPLFLDATNDFVGGFLPLLEPERPLYVFTLLDIQNPDGTVEGFTVAERARDFVEQVRERQPRGPYLLAGYCLGGKVMYETACLLEEAGEEVAMLLLVDTMFDARPLPLARRDMTFFRRLGLAYLAHALRRKLFYWRQRLLLRLGGLAGRGPASGTLLVARINQVLAAVNQEPVRPRLRAPLTLLISNEYLWKFDLSRLKRYTSGPFALHGVGGAHEQLFAPEHRERFQELLTACLKRAGEGENGPPGQGHGPA